MSAFQGLFEGKNVLVTGAGKGLGSALAKQLGALNANVYAVSRTQADLDALAQECPRIVPICTDVSDWTKTREALTAILPDSVDILVNNAAITGTTNFMDITSDCFDEITNINVKSVVNISQICASNMIKSGKGGSIVNISSMYALRPTPSCPMYSALKAALDNLTKTMAMDLGKHQIRVISMNLGYMWTPMMTKYFPSEESREKFIQNEAGRFPTGKVFVPVEEAVNSILFSVSGLVDSMTGCGVILDGGYCAT